MNYNVLHFLKNLAPPSYESPVKRGVYEALIDQAYYKETTPLWSGLSVGILTYLILLIFEHDWLLHLWVMLYALLYGFRFLFRYLYLQAKLLTKKSKQIRYSSIQIIIWGAMSALSWVFLFFIVIQGYPIQSKIITFLALFLFSSATHLRYSLMPLWNLSFISVLCIPICLWLIFQGPAYILVSFGIMVYGIFMIITASSYFKMHFDALFLQHQKEHILSNLASSKKKMEKANEKLKRTNKNLLEEIKHRHVVEEKLTIIASHDNLTGLPNRVLLQDRINQVILSSKREGKYCGILFIDLDRFKLINDTHGHPFGDVFLQLVAQRLKQLLREEDTISRIGGDEFIVLISNLKREKDILPIAQKVNNALGKPYDLQNYKLICTASIGVSIFPSGGTTSDELIRHADIAMYRAKKKGGDLVLSYTAQMNTALSRRVYIESCIRNALSKKTFYFVYQPIINLKTGKIVGVEALLRMKGLRNEIIKPSEIIPVAEETGLIYSIGLRGFKEVCEYFDHLSIIKKSTFQISVNITFKEITNEKFIEDYEEIFNETGVDPSLLELELSEHLAMEHKDAVIHTLNQLTKLGSTVAIDHFGMGQSSLRSLKELPIHKLKIDQSFIQDLEHNKGSREIIDAILSLVKSFNLLVVAEGIDTASKLDYLKKTRCDFGQGNFICKPLSQDKLLPFLENYI